MYTLISRIVVALKRVVPKPVVRFLRKPYHFLLAALATLLYGFPARRLVVIGVTGTKGKSTVSEMLYAILTGAGYSVALASTIRFVTPKHESPNLFKMTMQGRGFIQDFLTGARRDGATHAIVEITSEGVLDFRHRFLLLDGLVVTNIQREHIERHGSFENYIAAKREIVSELERSRKKGRVLVSNADDEYAKRFLDEARVPKKIGFSSRELPEFDIRPPFPGTFSAMNALAALKMAEVLGVPRAEAQTALRTMPQVKGRLEPIECGQPFTVIVDYAHTPDSLRALYGAFLHKRKICVLGNTGGGRDTWKRPEMGGIADTECDSVILTNEDPYDEDQRAIIDAMAVGMKRPPVIELNRRAAISKALEIAMSLSKDPRNQDVAVLISGKGTDPYIMGARGEKLAWSDAQVAREELEKLGFRN